MSARPLARAPPRPGRVARPRDAALDVTGSTEVRSVARYLEGIGELTDVPDRSPSRGPPYWKSVVLRRRALGDAA